MEYKNIDCTESFSALQERRKAVSLKKVLDAKRVQDLTIDVAGLMQYNYAAKPVDADLVSKLQALADEQALTAKYKAVLDGEFMNTGENRRVLHHLTRGQLGETVSEEGKDLRAFYAGQQQRIYDFAAQIHAGEITGSTGKAFKQVVQIGIGGSDLGPRALYLALDKMLAAEGKLKMQADFISNVDPDDANAVLEGLDFETTLFILVSKSGTTQETLANQSFVLEKIRRADIAGMDPTKHMIAVTSATSPLAGNPDYLDSFYIDDYIGGRYSSCSAVGGAVLTLAFGKEVFAELLEGAHATDKAAMNPKITENAALMDAMIGVYERNVLGFSQTAVLPYSQALSRFPAHLQQMDMESNGKRVNRFGEPVDYSTGPVIFGEPGTNGQHSFYQLLHQGTDIVPLQFIGFTASQIDFDLEIEGSTSQGKLKANLAAQIVAFALGKEDENPNKNFPGERPSSLIHAPKLTPAVLGALLAHFENKVLFQGFAWNLNSFDQEGVQLGKLLAKKVLSGQRDGALDAFSGLLGL